MSDRKQIILDIALKFCKHYSLFGKEAKKKLHLAADKNEEKINENIINKFILSLVRDDMEDI